MKMLYFKCPLCGKTSYMGKENMQGTGDGWRIEKITGEIQIREAKGNHGFPLQESMPLTGLPPGYAWLMTALSERLEELAAEHRAGTGETANNTPMEPSPTEKEKPPGDGKPVLAAPANEYKALSDGDRRLLDERYSIQLDEETPIYDKKFDDWRRESTRIHK